MGIISLSQPITLLMVMILNLLSNPMTRFTSLTSSRVKAHHRPKVTLCQEGLLYLNLADTLKHKLTRNFNSIGAHSSWLPPQWLALLTLGTCSTRKQTHPRKVSGML